MSQRVSFNGVSVTYPGMSSPALDDVSLDVPEGELLVLVGPSGCGKSTFLRALAGLEGVSSGQIFIGDRDVTRVPAKDRDVAMVFQNYALYPQMTVAQNMGFALRIAKAPKAEIQQRVAEAARLLDLEPYLDRKPAALSGGQRQRVAMGRAIVREPQVFLMDEPLSNLDAQLRVQTRAQIATLQRRLGTTMVYVTHDQVEAMTLGDRVAILKDGVVQQVDAPAQLYAHPDNAFVASFIGSPSMNVVDVAIVDGGVDLAGTIIPVERTVLDQASSARVLLGMRPEDLRLEDSGAAMTVQLVEMLGADAYVYGRLEGSDSILVARCDPAGRPEVGTVVHVRPTQTHVFQVEGDQSRIS
jgi:multiple sugar transport system ATP-binding protein